MGSLNFGVLCATICNRAVRLTHRAQCLFGHHHYIKIIDKVNLTSISYGPAGGFVNGIVLKSHRGCAYCDKTELYR